MSTRSLFGEYFIGVDVGTGSVRAALFRQDGKLFASSSVSIETWNPKPDFYQQSSENIWSCACEAVKEAVSKSGINSKDIRGIGFDATCSLVILDKDLEPVSVCPETNDPQQNIILWMDHRATSQAKKINESKHSVLKYVGGKVSVEMQLPKILWIKEQLPETWKRTYYLMDLPDYLTFRATGNIAKRSICSTTCKWTFTELAGWPMDFFDAIGLSELKQNSFAKIGNEIVQPGTNIGNINTLTAKSMGLDENDGIVVGASLIDAYAGALGTLGAGTDGSLSAITQRLSLICGTSSCHIALNQKSLFVDGIWGPYRSVLVPNLWAAEGGQSVTGQLITHVIETHPAYEVLKEMTDGQTVYAALNDFLHNLSENRGITLTELVRDIHFYPDFHGNRSPFADPSLKGAIVGFSLNSDIESLALLYLATMISIALQTRQIVQKMKSSGYDIREIVMSGGLCKNRLFVKIHADVLQMPIFLPKYIDNAVLCGAAICAYAASNNGPNSLLIGMNKLSLNGEKVSPSVDTKQFYEKKYSVFCSMAEDQKRYQATMK